MASEKFRPKPIRLRMPQAGLANWFDLAGVLLQLARGMVLRLIADGVARMDQVAGGLRLVVNRNTAPVDTGGDGPWSGDDDASCMCTETPILEVKKTFTCGMADCCGQPVFDEIPAVRSAGLVTITQSCTMLDYTGSSLETYSCSRVITNDYDKDGNGTVAVACSVGPPSCGAFEHTEEGCEDAPECSGPPGPGYKCYEVDEEEKAYAKSCYYSSLGTAAMGAAGDSTDEEWTMEVEASMMGAAAGVNDGYAFINSWEFRRRHSRKPVRITVELTEADYPGGENVTVSEESFEISKTPNSGIYAMTMPPSGRQAVITDVTIVIGRA